MFGAWSKGLLTRRGTLTSHLLTLLLKQHSQLWIALFQGERVSASRKGWRQSLQLTEDTLNNCILEISLNLRIKQFSASFAFGLKIGLKRETLARWFKCMSL